MSNVIMEMRQEGLIIQAKLGLPIGTKGQLLAKRKIMAETSDIKETIAAGQQHLRPTPPPPPPNKCAWVILFVSEAGPVYVTW